MNCQHDKQKMKNRLLETFSNDKKKSIVCIISIPILLMGFRNQLRNSESVTFTFFFIVSFDVVNVVFSKKKGVTNQGSLSFVLRFNLTKSKQTSLKNSEFIVS